MSKETATNPPTTIDECKAEIERVSADLGDIAAQLELERSGTTNRTEADPSWQRRASRAYRRTKAQLGALRATLHDLRKAESKAVRDAEKQAIAMQLASQKQANIAREAEAQRRADERRAERAQAHIAATQGRASAVLRGLKAHIATMDPAIRAELYAVMDEAERKFREEAQAQVSLGRSQQLCELLRRPFGNLTGGERHEFADLVEALRAENAILHGMQDEIASSIRDLIDEEFAFPSRGGSNRRIKE